MDLDKKLKEIFKTQDKKFVEGLSITETDWHYDGDGKTIEQVGDTGAFVPRTIMGRIVEYLKQLERPGLTQSAGPKSFEVRIRLDIRTKAEGDRKEVIGNSPYDGTVDEPVGLAAEELRLRFPKAWDEFKLHRGFIYHSGQWIKSSYVAYLEEQEKLNVSTKSKPGGSH